MFDIFNHIAEMVKRKVPGCKHPVFKANNLEDNFAIALDRSGVKSKVPERYPELSLTSGANWKKYCRIFIQQDRWTRKFGRVPGVIRLTCTLVIQARDVRGVAAHVRGGSCARGDRTLEDRRGRLGF